jgi:hypothetical protein
MRMSNAQPPASRSGHISSLKNLEGGTFARLVGRRRLLGFDAGDWSILIGGLVLAGLLAAYI